MNFQTMPRGDKTVKKAIVPKLDVLVFADYSQIELRFLAVYAALLGDDGMLKVFLEKRDIHTESTIGALHLTREPTDDERQVGKVLNYSMTYAGGTPTLRRQLGISYEEAASIRDNFHEKWPGIRLVETALTTRMMERGYIETMWGRPLHPKSERLYLNTLLQGNAADLLRHAAVKVHRYLDSQESHIVDLIHDEIMFDARLDELPDLAMKVPILMSDPRVAEYLPVDVDIEISRTNWGGKEPYELQHR